MKEGGTATENKEDSGNEEEYESEVEEEGGPAQNEDAHHHSGNVDTSVNLVTEGAAPSYVMPNEG